MLRRLALALMLGLLPGVACAQSFPTGWAGYATHSVTTEPGSNLTDFTYIVSLNQLPSDFWTNVQTDGDDIRASSDSAGSNRLPVDIIEFTDSGSSGSGLIAVKFSGTKSSSSDQPIYIWAGNASATLPADSDTYGADNAYAAHWKAFYPNGGGNDRTVNANNLTMTGSPTVGGSSGPINGSTATDFNGSSQYGRTTSGASGNMPLSLVGMFHSDASSGSGIAISLTDGNSSASTNWFLLNLAGATNVVQGGIAAGGNFGPSPVSAAYSDSTWGHAAAVFASATSRTAYLNSTAGTPETTSRTPASIESITVGVTISQIGAVSNYFDGRLSLVSWHSVDLSADWIAYHKEMLDDPDQSDFFGTWSWTATGGGGSTGSAFFIGASLTPHRARFVQSGNYQVAEFN